MKFHATSDGNFGGLLVCGSDYEVKPEFKKDEFWFNFSSREAFRFLVKFKSLVGSSLIGGKMREKNRNRIKPNYRQFTGNSNLRSFLIIF